MRTAGIVLAGGQSTRMGRSKAALEWHGSTLVRHAAGIVARAVDGPLVVVRAAGQRLPPLPAEVEVSRDARAGRGPLEGLAAGLAAVGARADAAFVCGVDTPLLHPALVRRLVAALEQDAELDVALPVADGFPHPLCAVYRTRVAAPLGELLAADRLALRALLERCRVAPLDERALLTDADVAASDPQLHSLRNVNDRAAYEAVRAWPAPLVRVAGRGELRAATLAQAGGPPATVNGRAVHDPQAPLVAGDVIRPGAGEDYTPV